MFIFREWSVLPVQVVGESNTSFREYYCLIFIGVNLYVPDFCPSGYFIYVFLKFYKSLEVGFIFCENSSVVGKEG